MNYTSSNDANTQERKEKLNLIMEKAQKLQNCIPKNDHQQSLFNFDFCIKHNIQENHYKYNSSDVMDTIKT